MNPKPVKQAKTPELALALPALRRARKRAEEIAIATNTALIQVENGQVVRVLPGAQGERPLSK
jgi:hypothetical protein